MTVSEYTSADEAGKFIALYLRKKISDRASSLEPYEALATDLLSIWTEKVETVRPRGARPAHVAGLKWVIRDDDLKVLDAILDGLKASAGAGFFVLANSQGAASIVAAAGLFAGVVKLAYNAVSKGVVLSSSDYAIISALFGQRDGLTDEQLLGRLRASQSDWTVEAVRTGLATLSEASSRSGKIALVWKTADNRWRTTGV